MSALPYRWQSPEASGIVQQDFVYTKQWHYVNTKQAGQCIFISGQKEK